MSQQTVSATSFQNSALGLWKTFLSKIKGEKNIENILVAMEAIKMAIAGPDKHLVEKVEQKVTILLTMALDYRYIIYGQKYSSTSGLNN
jgi:hypothetical protein